MDDRKTETTLYATPVYDMAQMHTLAHLPIGKTQFSVSKQTLLSEDQNQDLCYPVSHYTANPRF